MSFDPAIGAWVEADPEQYVDGPNRYQAFESNPVARVDPSGLQATAPATTQVAADNEWTEDQVELIPSLDKFTNTFVSGAAWGYTHATGTWKDLNGCDQKFEGKIHSTLHKLVLPSSDKLPHGIDQKKLQALVDAFNDAAKKHEQQVNADFHRWFSNRCTQGDPNAEALEQKDKKWGKGAPPEVQAQKEQYGLLLPVLKVLADAGDEGAKNAIGVIQKRLASK